MQRRTMSPSAISSPSSHRVVRVLGLGRGVDAHRDAVLEREPPVPGEVVGVRVRLDRADDADVAPLGLVEVLLDREGRIDDDGVTGTWIADEVRRTAERVVDELREDHGRARPYQRLPLFLLKCAWAEPAHRVASRPPVGVQSPSMRTTATQCAQGLVGRQLDDVAVRVGEVDGVGVAVILEAELDPTLFQASLRPADVLALDQERDVTQAGRLLLSLGRSHLRLEESDARAERAQEDGPVVLLAAPRCSSPSTSAYQAIERARSLTLSET